MYDIEIREGLDRTFRKLAKRDALQMEVIAKKVKEIAGEPHAYKPLRFPLVGQTKGTHRKLRLVFSIDEARNTIVLEDYAQHDEVYRTR